MANRNVFIGVMLGFGAVASSGALAEVPGVAATDDTRYYFAFDEGGLRQDLSRIRYFYVDSGIPVETAEPEDGAEMVFVGNPDPDGFAGFRDSALSAPMDPATVAGSWFDQVSVDWAWRPEVSGAGTADARDSTRGLALSGSDRMGVRADLTAMLNGGHRPEPGASVWRITGMLGTTSVSLATPDGAPADGVGVGDLSWDIGVGWSSGAVSLNAGYQGTYRGADSLESGPAILSLGADYAVVPGLSLYGELNVVDDPGLSGDARLGTVIILGTGVNF